LKVFASDLDQTLIYSRKWLADLPQNHREIDCVEVYNEKSASFMLSKASKYLKDIHDTYTFVPVTTRTRSQFERIHFKDVEPKLAIVANGGMILVDGQLDVDWETHISETLKSIRPLKEMQSIVDHLRDLDNFKKFGYADDLFFYIVMHTNEYDVSAVEKYIKTFEKEDWGIHIHGRKIYFIPNCISKGHALKYVKEKYGFSYIVSAGDSSLDLPLENESDFFYVPKHGGIADEVSAEQRPPEEGLLSGLFIIENALSKLNAHTFSD